MKPSEALDRHRDSILETADRFGARKIMVFGSVLHRRDRETSDLDLLVEMAAGTTLLDMVGFQEELEATLGVRVDVLTANDLPPRVRRRVLQEARPL